jgi:hypothetical protein
MELTSKRSAESDHDFPEMAAAFEMAVGFLSLGEGKCPVDDRAQAMQRDGRFIASKSARLPALIAPTVMPRPVSNSGASIVPAGERLARLLFLTRQRVRKAALSKACSRAYSAFPRQPASAWSSRLNRRGIVAEDRALHRPPRPRAASGRRGCRSSRRRSDPRAR